MIAVSEGREYSLFFMCSSQHRFLVPQKDLLDFGQYEDGGFPCTEDGCSADSTFLREGFGYCGNCSGPVWRKNPWWGSTIIRVRRLTSPPEVFRMYVCEQCADKREKGMALVNRFCACCGVSVDPAPGHEDQIICHTCIL